jgi:hypothetical protein
MPRSIALLEPAAFSWTNCSGNRTKLVIGHAPSIGILTRGSARIGDITYDYVIVLLPSHERLRMIGLDDYNILQPRHLVGNRLGGTHD